MCATLPVTHYAKSRTRCKNNGNTWCVHSKRMSVKIYKSKNKTNVNKTILICLVKKKNRNGLRRLRSFSRDVDIIIVRIANFSRRTGRLLCK